MRNPFKRETLDDLEFYDEYEYDEPQIIETYTEDEFNENVKSRKKYKLYKRIINIVFSIILILLVMISIDVISVSRYNVGPFFAIKTSTLKDGGTKIYYGLGYKVIKYHQEIGRRDTDIGLWNLKYTTEIYETSDIDLAIEFETDYKSSLEKYFNNLIKFDAIVKEVNINKNELTLEYLDEDNKYTLDIICKMADKNSNINIFNTEDKATIIGVINNYKAKDNKEPNSLYLNNCFAESQNAAEIVEFED